MMRHAAALLLLVALPLHGAGVVMSGGDVSAGLVGRWTCNTSYVSGGDITDRSSEGNDITNSGATVGADFCTLDDDQDGLEFSDNTIYSFTKSTAFSGVVLFEDADADASSGSSFISKTDRNPEYTGWEFGVSPAGSIRFSLVSDYDSLDLIVGNDASVTSIEDGARHCAAFTYDGSGLNTGIELYLDSSQLSVARFYTLSGSVVDNAVPFAIGDRLQTGRLRNPWNTIKIYEARVYQKELVATEVSRVCNAMLADREPSSLSGAVHAVTNSTKGLVLDVPGTSTWTQDATTTLSDRSASGDHPSVINGGTIGASGTTLVKASNQYIDSGAQYALDAISVGLLITTNEDLPPQNPTIKDYVWQNSSLDQVVSIRIEAYYDGNWYATILTDGDDGGDPSKTQNAIAAIGTINSGTTFHLLMTWESGDNVRLYKNGSLVATSSGTATGSTTINAGENFNFGCSVSGAGCETLSTTNSTLSNMRVWDRELSAAEVAAEYARATSGAGEVVISP